MATIISGGPSARRVASSSSSMPMTATTRSTVRRCAGAARQLGVEEEDVGRAECAHGGEDPVLDRDVVAGRALECGKCGEGEKHREGQVDGACLGVVEHPESEEERQRRGDTRAETGTRRQARRTASCRVLRRGGVPRYRPARPVSWASLLIGLWLCFPPRLFSRRRATDVRCVICRGASAAACRPWLRECSDADRIGRGRCDRLDHHDGPVTRGLHQTSFFVVLRRTVMQRGGQAILDHLLLLQIGKCRMQFAEAVEVLEHRFDDHDRPYRSACWSRKRRWRPHRRSASSFGLPVYMPPGMMALR